MSKAWMYSNVIDPVFGGNRKGALQARSYLNLGRDGGAGGDGDQLDAILAILLRRWRFIMWVTLAATLVATIVALLIPPKYTARAQLMVDVGGGQGSAAADVTILGEAIDTHLTMLNSAPYLQSVVDSLVGDSAGGAGGAGGRGAAVAAPRRGAGEPDSEPLRDAAPKAESAAGNLAQRLAVWFRPAKTVEHPGVPSRLTLERNLRTIQERRSRVILIAYTDKDRKRAAHVANRIADLYVGTIAERVRAEGEREMESLVIAVAQAKAALDSSRTAMAQLTTAPTAGETGVAASHAGSGLAAQELGQQATANLETYIKLLRRQSDLREQQAIRSIGIHVLSHAAPPEFPSSHNPLFLIVPAFIIFGLGTTVLTIFADQRDKTIRSAADAQEVLGVPHVGEIGMVSLVPAGASDGDLAWLANEPELREPLRISVAALDLVDKPVEPETLLIAPVGDDGDAKFIAVGLGTHLASLGRRVVVVDIGAGGGGVMEAAAKAERETSERPSLAACVRASLELDIDIAAMPQTKADTLALLANGAIADAIEQLKKSYDYVIICGRPLLASAEGPILARHADRIVLALQWGRTTREDLRRSAGLVLQAGRGARKDVRTLAAIVAGSPRVVVGRGPARHHPMRSDSAGAIGAPDVHSDETPASLLGWRIRG